MYELAIEPERAREQGEEGGFSSTEVNEETFEPRAPGTERGTAGNICGKMFGQKNTNQID